MLAQEPFRHEFHFTHQQGVAVGGQIARNRAVRHLHRAQGFEGIRVKTLRRLDGGEFVQILPGSQIREQQEAALGILGQHRRARSGRCRAIFSRLSRMERHLPSRAARPLRCRYPRRGSRENIAGSSHPRTRARSGYRRIPNPRTPIASIPPDGNRLHPVHPCLTIH